MLDERMPTPDETDVSGPAATMQVGPDASDHAADAWPRRGQLVGRYVVLDRLGAGAMGVIWRAYDPELDRRIALKLVRGTKGAVARARLVREAQTLARLSHDNIVAVFDVGTEGDEVFVAMEWIDGRDLSAWLHAPPGGRAPAWRDVLDLLERAGRGLQAAHDAGIVHRDFKPANVLLSDDGRVAVGDFGLARADEEPVGGDEWGAEARQVGSESLTAIGTTVGTPAYMAPEQHHGAPAHPRADQYALAIALYEGFYGTRPFTATAIDDLSHAKARGAPVPIHGAVPRRIWPILARALAPDPAQRYGSIADFLIALRRAADAPRRRARAGAAIAVVAAAVLLVVRPWDSPPTVCAGVDADADAIWNDAARARIESAIAGTSVAYAATAATLATEGLDRNIGEWRDARREACAATWIRGEQSSRALDLRMACLDRVLGRTAATIAVLHDVDARRVERVAELIAALPEVIACDDATAPTGEVPTATDAESAALLRALDDANARLITADPEIGNALAELTPRIIGRGDSGLHAQLELVRGQWLDQSGDADAAMVALREATRLARTAGHTRTEAEAWIALVRSSGRTRRVDHGRFYGEVAGALLETLPESGDLAADAALQLGVLAFTVGADDEAAGHFATALELYEHEHGPTHARVGDVLAKAAGVELRRGSAERAATMLERAIEIARTSYGDGHPKLATAMGNLGIVYAEQRRWDVALSTMAGAATMLEAAWGPDHPAVGTAADSTGDVLRRAGRPLEARASFERAIAIFERAFGPDHPAVSSALLGLGQALIDGGDTARAREPLERALRLADPGRVPPVQRADIQLFLARALERDDPKRARGLADAALAVYRTELRPEDDRLPEAAALMERLPPPSP